MAARAKGRRCARRKITLTLPGRHKTLPPSAIMKSFFARCGQTSGRESSVPALGDLLDANRDKDIGRYRRIPKPVSGRRDDLGHLLEGGKVNEENTQVAAAAVVLPLALAAPAASASTTPPARVVPRLPTLAGSRRYDLQSNGEGAEVARDLRPGQACLRYQDPGYVRASDHVLTEGEQRKKKDRIEKPD